MKLAYKIVLANVAIAIIITCLFLIRGNNSGSDVALAFGLVCLAMSLLDLFFGIIMLISKDKEWGNGMLFSFAFLMLLSGISCGSGFNGMRF